MSCRSANDKHLCPLFKKEIYWSQCYEVQEVRNYDMELFLFPEEFSITEANITCEKCKWYMISKNS